MIWKKCAAVVDMVRGDGEQWERRKTMPSRLDRQSGGADGVSYFYLFMALYAVVDASVVVVAVGEVAFDSSALRVE